MSSCRLRGVTRTRVLCKSLHSVRGGSLSLHRTTMKAVRSRWVRGFITFLSISWQAGHCTVQRRRRTKAAGLSVDFRHVLVFPIEVAAGVQPALGVGVRVGAHLKPPERHTKINNGKTHTGWLSCTRHVTPTLRQQKQDVHRGFVFPLVTIHSYQSISGTSLPVLSAVEEVTNKVTAVLNEWMNLGRVLRSRLLPL